MPLKPGPKPIADSTGKPDQRRRDNKDTPSNTKDLKPAGLFKNLCQPGKIRNTKGHTDEYRDRC
ncbi:MAG: hypothetical protein PHE16_03775 [Aliarcobacter sp.]|nr:hypothetical protein [Aliarcobacter sp.]